MRFSRWLIAAGLLLLAEGAAIVAAEVALTTSAQAQFRDERFPFLSRQRPRSGGFFGNLFGPSTPRYYERGPAEGPADYSRAPPPRKAEKGEPMPTTSVVVMGDGMADWLAYGLEDAFADSPEIAIIRKDKLHSGLLRYESKGDLDWWHVARETVTQEKPNYVVMMLGVSDRQNIREKDLAKEAEKKAKDEQDKKDADKSAQNKDQAEETDQSTIIAPEPAQGKAAHGIIEFRSDQWADIYSKRIDATIAAMKSKGVPVFWVGLPSIRGTKSTADAVYLNDLYRARAERAGAIYIDVWDGFVDETGKFATYGPDYEGQMRRLRSGDGVFFTKAGARKLAHYVERELRRAMNNRTLVSLPVGPVGPLPPNAKSTVRPLAGPVVPLTVTPPNSEELVGAGAAQPVHSDATAMRVLVEGEPLPAPPGRADDFVWPPGSEARAAVPPVAAMPAAPPPPPANTVARTEPAAAAVKPPEEHKRGVVEKTSQNITAKPKLVRPEEAKRKPVTHDNAPRPPRAVPRSGGPFGWFR